MFLVAYTLEKESESRIAAQREKREKIVLDAMSQIGEGGPVFYSFEAKVRFFQSKGILKNFPCPKPGDKFYP